MIIEVNKSEKADILKFDGELLMNSELIIEEMPNKFKTVLKNKICRYFKENKCNKGKYCMFLHPMECRNFKATGQCRFGNNCRYEHKEGNGQQRVNESSNFICIKIIWDFNYTNARML